MIWRHSISLVLCVTIRREMYYRHWVGSVAICSAAARRMTRLASDLEGRITNEELGSNGQTLSKYQDRWLKEYRSFVRH